MLSSVARNAILYTLSAIAVRATGLITLPIVSRYLSPIDYGNVAYVSVLVTIASTILGCGHETTLARYYLQAGDKDERANVASTWFVYSVWGSALLLTLLGAVAAATYEVTDRGVLILWAAATIPGQFAVSLCGAVLRAEQKAAKFAVLSFGSAVLSIAVSLSLVVFGWGAVGVFAGHALGLVVSLPAAATIAKVRPWTRVELPRIQEMLVFGTPIAATNLAFLVSQVADRFLLDWLRPPGDLGLFAIAVALTGMLNIVIQGFGQAWLPDAIERSTVDPGKGAECSVSAAAYQLYVLGLAATLLCGFAQIIMIIMAGPEFRSAWNLIPPLAFATYIYGMINYATLGVLLSKRTGKLLYVGAINFAINVTVCLLLIPKLGAMGAALAAIVANLAMIATAFALSSRSWPFNYFRSILLVPTLSTAFTCLVSALAPQGIAPNMLLGIMATLAYLASGWWFGLLPVNSILNRIMHKTQSRAS